MERSDWPSEAQDNLIFASCYHSVLMAHNSVNYYKLQRDRCRQREVKGRWIHAVVVLIFVCGAGAFPEWTPAVGISGVVAVLVALREAGKKTDETTKFEIATARWNDILRGANHLLADIEAAYPNVDRLKPETTKLRKRWIDEETRDSTTVDETLQWEAARQLAAERGLRGWP